MENFNLKKFLVENKLTTNSRLLERDADDDFSFDASYFLTKVIPRLEQERVVAGRQIADLKELTKAFELPMEQVKTTIDFQMYDSLIEKLESSEQIAVEERDGLIEFLYEYATKAIAKQVNEIITKIVNSSQDVEDAGLEVDYDLVDPNSYDASDLKVVYYGDRAGVSISIIYKKLDPEEYEEIDDDNLVATVENLKVENHW
jgi:hypothetical protein